MATDGQLVCASTQTAHALSFSDMDALFEEFDTGDFPAFNPQFSITSKPSTVAVEVAAARAQELGVYVLAPGAAPAHASLRVDCQTTVGDIRAFIRDSLGEPGESSGCGSHAQVTGIVRKVRLTIVNKTSSNSANISL